MNCFLYIYLFKAVYTNVLVKTSELKTSLEHDWPWEVLGSCAPITYNKCLNVASFRGFISVMCNKIILVTIVSVIFRCISF